MSTQSLMKQPQRPWTRSRPTHQHQILNATIPSAFSFGDIPPTSPPDPIGGDIFVDYIDYSAFDDPTPELVAGLATNPSPESASDRDPPGCAGPSPQISHFKSGGHA